MRSFVVKSIVLLISSCSDIASGSVIFPIADNAHYNVGPRVDGNYVVWTNASSASNPQPSNDVEALNLTTRQSFVVAGTLGHESWGRSSGDIAVWANVDGPGPHQLNARNLVTGAPIEVVANANDQVGPSISGGTVIWQEKINGELFVRGRKLADPITSSFNVSGPIHPRSPSNTDIAGNTVVWIDRQTSTLTDYRAFWRDLTNSTVNRVSLSESVQTDVRTSERFIIWQDNRDNKSQIYARDLVLNTEFPIDPFSDPSGRSFQTEPAIDGNVAVWTYDNGTSSAVYGRDLLTGAPAFQITPNDGISRGDPDISGNVVVWQQSAGNRPTIWGTILPEPGAAGVALFTCQRLSRRRRY